LKIERNIWTRIQLQNNPPELSNNSSLRCVKNGKSLFIFGKQYKNVQIFQIDIPVNRNGASEGEKIFTEKLVFKGVFLEKDFSDITFKVQGKEFYGHKIILAKANQHFWNLFKSNLQ